MKRILIIVTALIAAGSAIAQEVPQWVRRSAISPDGKTIAFSYKGDIYTVPTEGGLALQITSNKAYETDPLWTPDGGRIVFSSWREGSKDIFVSSASGGTPVRITTMPGNETPLAVSPDGYVYYNWYTTALQSPQFDGFPGDPALYRSSLEGGAPELVTSLTVCDLSIGPDGTFLYEDWKGYEDPLRKHHTSSVTRDIWQWDGKLNFRKLTSYKGEDRNPVFGADGDTFYYLSEEGGSNINLWKSSISNPASKTRLTSYDKNPARFLTVSGEGTLCYSYNGELFILRDGSEPTRVNILVNRDEPEKAVNQMQMKSATAMAVSPDGKEIALVMRGDVFVTSTEFATTRRITNTPEQERGVSFSKDGRELYYASERNGCWSIYKTSLTNKDDKYFTYSASFKEERVSPEGETSFQVQVSPDGKYIAYLRDRTELVVMPTSGSGKPRSLHKGINYSYSDGDQSFAWSPDSRYILTNWMADGGWNNEDIAVVEVESGKITNLTRSGYSDGGFHWALGGKAMTWESDKMGFRSHGSWGAESDIYIMFFDGKAYAQFARSKEQKEIDKMLLGEKKAEKEEKKAEKDSLAKKVEKVNLDLDNHEDRIRRLTRFSNMMGDHYLTQDGTKLYFTQRLEKGFDLCMIDLEKGDLTVVKKGVMGNIYPAPDGKSIFLFRGAQLSKFDISTNKDKAVSFNGDYEFKPQQEREYIFEHCWKQVQEKFYDPALHGIDWQYYHDNYAAKLPFINNDFDFTDLLSEMLGELNGSHTGARYRAPGSHQLGHIGILADPQYKGDGIKIAEILPGGAINSVDTDIKAGDIITAIEGHEIKAGENWLENLYDKVDKKILVNIKSGGKKKELFITPTATDAPLLYKRWVRQREEMVEKLSGGKVGYVHIEGMNSPSYRELYSKALGKYRNCDALIVDTRHNGGGWLHDDLVTFLGGREYHQFKPRGQYMGHEPFNKWTKPSCVLMGEDNYSDASGFPHAYRALGIGKLIGAPVPGTMTAVWWENQVNALIVFGIPQVGNWSPRDNTFLENFQIEPDILIYNDPASTLSGRDLQLEAAVAEMLK